MSPVPSGGRWLRGNPSLTGHACSNSKNKVVFPVPVFSIAQHHPNSLLIIGNESQNSTIHPAFFLDLRIFLTLKLSCVKCWALTSCTRARFPEAEGKMNSSAVLILIFFPIFWSWLIEYHCTSVVFPRKYLQWWEKILSRAEGSSSTCVSTPLGQGCWILH